MKQQWQKLESYLQIHNPLLLNDLNPPATNVEIRELEHLTGINLPSDYVECLKIHNGQKGDAQWLFDGEEFLSTHKIMLEWSAWEYLLNEGEFRDRDTYPSTQIKVGWWRSKWLPFTSNGCGDHLCLDTDPSRVGSFGQVIKIYHDCAERNFESAEFYEWFVRFVGKSI